MEGLLSAPPTPPIPKRSAKDALKTAPIQTFCLAIAVNLQSSAKFVVPST